MPIASSAASRDPARERRATRRRACARRRPTIPPKYFYDALGCALFGAICELPEYYPTRTERAIFAAHRGAIAAAVGSGAQLVDLGAGDCGKAGRLFAVPGAAALRRRRHRRRLPAARRSRACSAGIPRRRDAGRRARLLAGAGPAGRARRRRRHVLLPGLVDRQLHAGARRAAFLAPRTASPRPGSGLLIGVDLVKDVARARCRVRRCARRHRGVQPATC